MELRLLQSFLVLAEELHFGRAAARLFIAQPPLTKQIHQLEKQLGVQLFERHPRGARLTPAGEALKVEAQQIFSAVDTAVHNVRNADHGSAGRLVLGYSGAVGAAQLPAVLRSITKANPGIDIEVKKYANASQVASATIDGEIDFGQVLLPFEHPDLSTRSVSHHDPVVVVASTHKFAERSSVRTTELENEGFVTPRRYSGSALIPLIESIFDKEDFSPKVIKEAPDADITMAYVAGGIGISITVTGVQIYGHDLRFIPFDDKSLPGLESAVAWRTKNPSALLEKVLTTVLDISYS
ncbi:HTH-type transcriptional regulator TdfR [Corynebacterium faecale]|uniref:LysR substrate-binding domain-containing protein n=1 Tax=Corynebacterium faecale TaxID=1758466 RepID=UPI0025B45630|nr:LysR substrate-binding domain-containing protein [Corynebacterium faecale]WJY90925.1 HTH-type transcriptional regulator TdfR [Corynebacterium faecale]